MAIARELAAQEDPVVIGCDHLLVGLARIDRGVAATMLSEAGVDRTALDDALAPGWGWSGRGCGWRVVDGGEERAPG